MQHGRKSLRCLGEMCLSHIAHQGYRPESVPSGWSDTLLMTTADTKMVALGVLGWHLPSCNAIWRWYSSLLDFSDARQATVLSTKTSGSPFRVRNISEVIQQSISYNMNQGFLPKNCHLWLIYTFDITLPIKDFQFINENLCKSQKEFGFRGCQLVLWVIAPLIYLCRVWEGRGHVTIEA